MATEEQLEARNHIYALQRTRTHNEAKIRVPRGQKRCTKCGEVKWKKLAFSRRKDGYWRSECNSCRLRYVHRWREKNPEAFAEAQRRYRKNNYAASTLKYRRLVYEFLGNKCNNPSCGFTDHRAFQIDHVNDDGATEREKNKFKGSTKWKRIYDDLIANRFGQSRYQLLCANCNAIKEYERRLLQFVQETPALKCYLPE